MLMPFMVFPIFTEAMATWLQMTGKITFPHFKSSEDIQSSEHKQPHLRAKAILNIWSHDFDTQLQIFSTKLVETSYAVAEQALKLGKKNWFKLNKFSNLRYSLYYRVVLSLNSDAL